jgi:hypothetical protein
MRNDSRVPGSYGAQVAFRHLSLTLSEQSSPKGRVVVNASGEGNAGKKSLENEEAA